MRDFFNQIAGWEGERRRVPPRKSSWNLLLIPLALIFWLTIWYGLFMLVWNFHITLYPQHNLRDFWQGGASLSSCILSFLMVFALLPGTSCLGLALANCVTWLIPTARRALDAEAIGYPEASFRKATRKLLLFCSWTLPAGLILSLLSAWSLVSLY